jgi:hypothetical protein
MKNCSHFIINVYSEDNVITACVVANAIYKEHVF